MSRAWIITLLLILAALLLLWFATPPAEPNPAMYDDMCIPLPYTYEGACP